MEGGLALAGKLEAQGKERFSEANDEGFGSDFSGDVFDGDDAEFFDF